MMAEATLLRSVQTMAETFGAPPGSASALGDRNAGLRTQGGIAAFSGDDEATLDGDAAGETNLHALWSAGDDPFGGREQVQAGLHGEAGVQGLAEGARLHHPAEWLGGASSLPMVEMQVQTGGSVSHASVAHADVADRVGRDVQHIP